MPAASCRHNSSAGYTNAVVAGQLLWLACFPLTLPTGRSAAQDPAAACSYLTGSKTAGTSSPVMTGKCLN